MTDDERKRILAHIEPSYRGAFGNLFYHAVREGAIGRLDVVMCVLHKLRGRRRPQDAAWAALVRENLDAAEDFAAYVIEQETLPQAERAARKAEQARQALDDWKATQPPTEKQIAYARSLGHQGPIGSRLEASQIIDRLKQPAHVPD